MSEMEAGTERLRALLGHDPNISEKKMFGGVAFMLNGNMLCGYTNKGKLMVRVGKELEAEARKLPGAHDMDFTGRKMGGMLFVDETALSTDRALAEWIALATRFVGALPAK
ncbi:MAG: TfoX/Sxy family protein [Alphaproteobacteria bacterium]|nr:TfoX/Sxy family protein [Alphaproteobacteria bacterium]